MKGLRYEVQGLKVHHSQLLIADYQLFTFLIHQFHGHHNQRNQNDKPNN